MENRPLRAPGWYAGLETRSRDGILLFRLIRWKAREYSPPQAVQPAFNRHQRFRFHCVLLLFVHKRVHNQPPQIATCSSSNNTQQKKDANSVPRLAPCGLQKLNCGRGNLKTGLPLQIPGFPAVFRCWRARFIISTSQRNCNLVQASVPECHSGKKMT